MKRTSRILMLYDEKHIRQENMINKDGNHLQQLGCSQRLHLELKREG